MFIFFAWNLEYQNTFFTFDQWISGRVLLCPPFCGQDNEYVTVRFNLDLWEGSWSLYKSGPVDVHINLNCWLFSRLLIGRPSYRLTLHLNSNSEILHSAAGYFLSPIFLKRTWTQHQAALDHWLCDAPSSEPHPLSGGLRPITGFVYRGCQDNRWNAPYSARPWQLSAVCVCERASVCLAHIQLSVSEI